eukprot:TRINITY_DN48616_c0_g1_i1.p1 TRINITY_DN48616_c0_g1~~TRINITY_DN48616_c0_g1_i1.p1  ORF type:complete len:361 (+),score=78.28 TRINITY_DN48616_c0_g1_i1:52-1083(+)
MVVPENLEKPSEETKLCGRKDAPTGYMQIGSAKIPKRVVIGVVLCFFVAFAFGMGFGIDPHTDDPPPWDRVSAIIGWGYTIAWMASFYPQLYLNWVRKSVVGLSFDFQVLNLVGFTCYSAFTISLFYITYIRDQYHKMYDGSNPSVRENDVVFAVHAVILTALTCSQIVMYDRGDQRVSPFTWLALVIFFIVFGSWAVEMSVNGGDYSDRPRPWIWLDFLNGLSWVKLGISIVKYTPQVYLNYKRKSTSGWNIYNILLDFTGGLLSTTQLLMDSISQDDWSAVTGNTVKFGLGFCSMFFDIIFMTQHYVLYKHDNGQKYSDIDEEEEEAPAVMGTIKKEADNV